VVVHALTGHAEPAREAGRGIGLAKKPDHLAAGRVEESGGAFGAVHDVNAGGRALGHASASDRHGEILEPTVYFVKTLYTVGAPLVGTVPIGAAKKAAPSWFTEAGVAQPFRAARPASRPKGLRYDAGPRSASRWKRVLSRWKRVLYLRFAFRGREIVKEAIHPKYFDVQARCACGATWKTRSTKQELHLEICSNCHPFFTGRQKLIDTEGRVERFTRKYGAQTVAQRKVKKDVAQKTA